MNFKKVATDDLNRNLKQAQRTYSYPIEIQKKSDPKQKENGSWTRGGWSTWKKVFSNIKNLYGSEYFTAGQVGKEATLKFYIRYMPSITNAVKEEFRIVFQGNTYNIEFVDNINFKNEELEIKAIERGITDASD